MIDSLRAEDYMTKRKRLVTLKPDMDVHDAMNLMLKKRYSGMPVIDEKGTFVGTFSEKDCLRPLLQAAYHHSGNYLVSDLMKKKEEVKTVETNTSIIRCAEIFIKGPYLRLPVMEDGEFMGQLSRSDVLRGILENKASETTRF